MSIEELIRENTSVMRELCAIIKAESVLKTEFLEKFKAEVARKNGDAGEPAKASKPKAEGRQITDSPEDRKPPSEAAELSADVSIAQKKVTELVDAATSEDDRKARRVDVAGLLTKIGGEGAYGDKRPLVSQLSDKDAKRLTKAVQKLIDEKYAAKVEPPAGDDEL